MPWTRTPQRVGRAESVSGPTSTRRLWPTSTVPTSRHCSSCTVLPARLHQRLRVAPAALLPPHRSVRLLRAWTASAALNCPVTTRCWALRCRLAYRQLFVANSRCFSAEGLPASPFSLNCGKCGPIASAGSGDQSSETQEDSPRSKRLGAAHADHRVSGEGDAQAAV